MGTGGGLADREPGLGCWQMPMGIEMRGEDGPAIQGPAQGVSPSSQLAFVRSAYEAAERAIRVADERIGYLLLFLGILIATISVRGDTILSLLTGQQYGPLARGLFFVGCLVFLGAEGISLIYAARSRRLAIGAPTDVPQALAHLAA
jgi:hypothetical protein